MLGQVSVCPYVLDGELVFAAEATMAEVGLGGNVLHQARLLLKGVLHAYVPRPRRG